MMTDCKPKLQVRPLLPGDAQPVRALILAGLAERWGILDLRLNPDLDDLRRSYAAGCFLVACHHERIVGCGAFLPLDGRTAQIMRMSTARSWRRRGVATLLLARLEAEAWRRGMEQLVLETTSSWESAISFYQRQGYQISHQEGGDTYFYKRRPANLRRRRTSPPAAPSGG